MKNLKFVVLLLFVSSMFACSENFSINFINIDILNSKNEVTNGEKLRVSIKAKDSEGIDYILIDIPVLNTSLRIEDFSDKNKWEFEEHFLVEGIDVTGEFEVFITLFDQSGEEYVETEKFEIE